MPRLLHHPKLAGGVTLPGTFLFFLFVLFRSFLTQANDINSTNTYLALCHLRFIMFGHLVYSFRAGVFYYSTCLTLGVF